MMLNLSFNVDAFVPYITQYVYYNFITLHSDFFKEMNKFVHIV